MDKGQDIARHNNDYLTRKEREIVDRFNPKRITSAFGQDKIYTEILTSLGLEENSDVRSSERKQLGALTMTMIQKMDDAFDDRRHTFKENQTLPQTNKLLEKLMQVNTNLHPEGVTVAELLNIILKASTNNDLYSPESQKLIAQDINYLRTTVASTLADTEHSPELANFNEALELRRITNGGEAALMFDLSFGMLISNPNYMEARQKVIDMALAMSLADDITDFTEDMKGEKVNSFLSCTRETGEYENLMSVFRTKGFKRQAKRGELEMSETSVAKKLAPEAYKRVAQTQKVLLDSIGSETLTSFYSIL